MKPKEILIFGASGFIGANLIRKLTRKNYKVTAVTRNIHSQKSLKLKTQSNYGYISLIEANIFDIEKIKSLINQSDICINLIGILYENRNNTFKNIHTNFPSILSKLFQDSGIEQFIHVSALGIDESASKSNYAKSKLDGEKLVRENFQESTILRPSVIFGSEDRFSNLFMDILSKIPIFPLYYGGKSKFALIHVSDLTEIILNIVEKKIQSEIIECIGPDVISFKEIIQKLSNSIEKERILVPVPLTIAKLMAKTMETIMSKPLLTLDQLRLLGYDSVQSMKYKTNFDLNMSANRKFELEIENWSYRFKDRGEYSKKNKTSN